MGTRATEVSAAVVVAAAARDAEEAATGAEEDTVSDTRLLRPRDLRA